MDPVPWSLVTVLSYSSGFITKEESLRALLLMTLISYE